MPNALPAAAAYAATPGDALGGYDVRAMPVRAESSTLAPVALGADTDADLVEPRRYGPRRDDPAPASLVGGEDLVAAELEDAQAPQHVSEGGFGGVGGTRLRYSSGVHSLHPFCGPGPGVCPHLRGHFLYIPTLPLSLSYVNFCCTIFA